MDERFSTPRAQASTSRSTASSSYGTPRSFNLQSSRSLQGYSSSDSDDITPRLTSNPGFITNEKNPELIRFNRASNSTMRDYSRDFRRFETQNPYQSRLSQSFDPRNATTSSPNHDRHDSYITSAWYQNKHESPNQSRMPHPHDLQSEDIFSLSRHGKVGHVERLLTSGVSSDIKDEHGNTILAIACQNNKKNIVKLALRYGTNINSCNYRGMTALHFCFKYGFGETLGSYLLSKGANPNITNKDGLTCYQLKH